MDGVEASLRRLQTDHIDLYQIHANDSVTPVEETLRALDTLVTKAKSATSASPTGRRGRSPRPWASPSSRTWPASIRSRPTTPSPAAISNANSFLFWNPKRSAFSSGARLPAACSPESSAATNQKPADSRRSEFDFPVVDKERTWKILDAMAPIAKAHDCSPARISLAWLLTKPVVTSVIIGAKRLDQLQDNLAAEELNLSEDEIKILDEVSALPPEYPGWMLPFQGADRWGDTARPIAEYIRQSGSNG